jgi:hypothetical protein
VATVRADYYIFYGKENEYEQMGGLFVHNRTTSAVKRVDFVRDRMSYVVLRARWCNIIILKVRVPTEEKSDDSKDGFYEELDLASTLKCFTSLRKQLKYQRLSL